MINFIVKLPLLRDSWTGETYDSIFIIIDQLTKYAHILPYKEAINAAIFAVIFI